MQKQKPTDIGKNRTGVKTSPIDSRHVEHASARGEAAAIADGLAIESERVRWARSAAPIGTVPPPGTVRGVIKTILKKLEGHQPTVFIDKLGERLAFERTGTRLYDALLVKFEAAHVHEGGPLRTELEKIRDDERRHFALVRDAIDRLGADPTAMTPSADIVSVAGAGWVQVLTDPRTTLSQCLSVILAAEAADTEGWTLLVNLAEQLGFEDLARQFNAALVQEEEHVASVRTWVARSLFGQSGVARTAEQRPPA